MLPTFATAKQLAVQIRRTHPEAYEPQEKSIHTVLQRHGITPKVRYYNNIPVKTYDIKNAKRILAQYMYELRQEDIDNDRAKALIQQNSITPNNTNKQQYTPRKHGETNAHRELDKQTLYEINSNTNNMNTDNKNKNKQVVKVNDAIMRQIVSESVANYLAEKILGAGESFTPYTDDEKKRNFDYLLTGCGRTPEERNPSYAKAKAEAEERRRKKQMGLEEKIEIDPENKGKFNATKKRTGKSTEELTHSKNPLTKKRAIFAQNAKKWNHTNESVQLRKALKEAYNAYKKEQNING